MPSKAIWIDKFETLEVTFFSFRAANLISIVFFTLIFSYLLTVIRNLGTSGFMMTVMLTYVSLSFFFGYLFVIADFTTLGYQTIPNASPNLMQTERGRLFKVAVITAAFLTFFLLIDSALPRLIYLFSCLILFPLALSVLILESSLFSALNPIKWFAVLAGVKMDSSIFQFILLQGLALFMAYIALFQSFGLLNLVTMAFFLAIMMTLFRSLGVVLHSNADALGLKVQYSKEVEAQQARRADDKALSDFCDVLHKLCGVEENEKAWQLLKDKLQQDKFESEADIFHRLRHWHRPKLAVKAGQAYIERLVARQDYRVAWQVLNFCFDNNNQDYKLESASTLLDLSTQAETFKQKTIIVNMLKFFEEDYPKHPKTAEALLTAARISADDLDDFTTAKTIMLNLSRNYPAIRSDQTYQTLRKILAN